MGSFKSFQLKRKFGIGPAALMRYLKTLKSGFRQGVSAGDVWQQGGVVLVDHEGDAAWQHIDDGPGDHAELEVILEQVKLLSD